MRSLLLDTNALLWVLTDDDRLGNEARASIVGAPEVRFSPVNVLELTIKAMLGRLPAVEAWPEAARSLGLVELPLTAAHAEALGEWPELVRHDPFDRMLLAQASVERLTLVTADARLLSLDVDGVTDARR